MASLPLKTNYRCESTRQQFYNGRSFAVSSDGSFLACVCDDSIKIVDSSNAYVKSTIEGDSDPITALALSPDDKVLFSAGHSRQIRVWDLETLKCLRSWKGHEGPVMRMACDASGGLLATAGADSKVMVWDVDGGFCTHYFKGHKGVVSSILFHPDPNRLLLFSGSDDATVRVWDLQSKKCIATLEKHFSMVTSLAISEDGLTLLSAGRDKVVNLWDLHDYGCKITVPTYEVLEAVCVVNSKSSFALCMDSCKEKTRKKRRGSSSISFITVGERGIVRIYSSDGAVCLFEQQCSDVAVSSDNDVSERGFTGAVLLPLDQGLLCATVDHQILFYSPTLNPEGDMKLSLSRRLVGDIGPIADMKFLGDEEEFLAVATNLEQVQVYDRASMSCSYSLVGHTDVVLCLDTGVSSSGRTLVVTGSKDKSVRLWETEGRRCIGVAVGHLAHVTAVAFSKKQRNFIVSGSSDGMLKVWSLDKLSNDIEELNSWKATAGVGAHDKDITSLAIAPNDSLVCSASRDRTARVWRRSNLVSEIILKGHKRPIYCVEFSPVDQCVMTASADKTIKIWAISDGACLKTFEGHTSSVLRASFITRGAQFVSCGADGLVKLWTVKTSECIATHDQHEDQVWALAVGKKTEMLVTGSNDAVVNLWTDSTTCDKQEAFHKEEEEVLRGQELENAVLDADYTKAIQLAFELRRPHRLYELFAELCKKGKVDGQVEKALSALGQEQFHLLFEYIREWNTKPKFCHVAQFVLFRVFSILPPTKIIEVKGIVELLEGLLPYSQRHYSRMDRLLRSTFLLDYTLREMSVIEPETSTRDSENKPELHSDLEDAHEEPVAENGNEVDKRMSEVVNEEPVAENNNEEDKQMSVAVDEVASATQRKRKPHARVCRSGERKKKVKGLASVNDSVMSLET